MARLGIKLLGKRNKRIIYLYSKEIINVTQILDSKNRRPQKLNKFVNSLSL